MGSSGTSQTTSTEPWDGQKPYLTYGFEAAVFLHKNWQPQYWTGDVVVAQNDITKNAWTGATLRTQAMTQASLIGGQVLSGSENVMITLLNDMLVGAVKLDPAYPYLQAIIDRDTLNPYLESRLQASETALAITFQTATIPALNTTFALAGRIGSGYHLNASEVAAYAFGQALATERAQVQAMAWEAAEGRRMDALRQLAASWDAERGRQTQVLQLAPVLADADWNDIMKAREVGAAEEMLRQKVLDNNRSKFEFDQWLPYERLRLYQSIIDGNYGSVSTSEAKRGASVTDYLNSALSVAGFLFCWVAREVYGQADPRWRRFQGWLHSRSPSWFFNLYARNGEGFAAWLGRHPWAKPPVRTLFNAILAHDARTADDRA